MNDPHNGPVPAGISRRSALGVLAATGLKAMLPHAAWGAEREPLFKISLAEWSLHRTIFAAELDHLNFAQTAKEKYGLDAVEYVSQFFQNKPADEKYLAEMKTAADDAGVKSLLIMVDGVGGLGDPDDAKRTAAVDGHKPWVDAAKSLGCHSVRVNAWSEGGYDEQVRLAADGLRVLTEFAEPLGINVIVENHGGLSSNGAWLAEVIKTVDHPMCGTLPDFGNFRIQGDEWYDRYTGVAELMPYAKAVSAKTHEFDDEGNETKTDYVKMIKIVLDAGYRGYIGIEYEGDTMSEHEGIMATKKLLEQVREELS